MSEYINIHKEYDDGNIKYGDICQFCRNYHPLIFDHIAEERSGHWDGATDWECLISNKANGLYLEVPSYKFFYNEIDKYYECKKIQEILKNIEKEKIREHFSKSEINKVKIMAQDEAFIKELANAKKIILK